MVSGINSDISQLQILRATQAFKKAVRSSEKVTEFLEDAEVPQIEDKVTLTGPQQEAKGIAKSEGNPILKDTNYVNEVKQYANKYGNCEINEEDINYALKYGRSILVNQLA